MKTNKNYTNWYVGISLVWCIFLVLFALSSQVIEGRDIFIGGAMMVLLAAIFSSYDGRKGPMTAVATIASIMLMITYPILRFLTSLSYDTLKYTEDYCKIALRPVGAPENFPIINGTLIFFTALGLLYITVSFLYWLKVLRKQPIPPNPYPWQFYFKSFFSLTRLLFLCIPLLLIVVITYIYVVCDYRGVGSNDWGIFLIFLSYFFLYPLSPRTIRGVAILVSLLFLTLIFISEKNYEHMLFVMRSSLDITPESLGADEMLTELLKFTARCDKMHLSLPEFRGNLLLFVGSDQAPDPLSWKDFILIITIGLYMLLNIVIEPQLKPPEKKEQA